MKRVLLYIVLSGLWILPSVSYGQSQPGIMLKTNLLHAATTTPNLGVEFSVHRRWSIDIWGAYNLIDYKGNTSLHHFLIQPEARYWFSQTFKGHFVGAHLLGGKYDLGGISFISTLKDHHYRGDLLGGGFSYGYKWRFNNHWGMEASLGLGFLTMNYDKYRCEGCAVLEARYKRNYFGPTRAALSLVYTLQGRNSSDGSRRRSQKSGDTYEQVFIQSFSSPSVEADSLRLVLKQIEEQNRRYQTTLDSLCSLRSAHPTDTPAAYRLKSSKGVMYIKYPLNETRILPDYEDNRPELARLDSLLHPLLSDSTIIIRSVRLTGYASPEGRYDRNANLANRRIVEVMNYLRSIYPLPDPSAFQLKAVAEDWDGLATALEASDKPYKEEALRIIRTVPLFDGRELELMKLRQGDPYRDMLTEFFPRLRRTEFIIEWEKKQPLVQAGK